MHKLKQLSASSFLRLLFAAFTFAFFCSAFIAPDRAEMFTGLRRIMTESSKVSTNYFDNGGYAGTFLNAGLVCLVLTALYSLPKVKVNATSCLAFLLTAGFCFWGVNILNLWFGFLGVLLYCLVKRENPANQINAMVFTTGICPLTAPTLPTRRKCPPTTGSRNPISRAVRPPLRTSTGSSRASPPKTDPKQHIASRRSRGRPGFCRFGDHISKKLLGKQKFCLLLT